MTVGTDTYITAAEANEIISTLLLSTDAQRVAWLALPDGDRDVYLLQAMMRIETIPFNGRKYDRNQALQFPRWDVPVVPTAIKHAQALEAAASIGMTKEAAHRAQLRAMGITSFSAGRISERYGSVCANNLYSLQTMQMLRRYVLGGVPFA